MNVFGSRTQIKGKLDRPNFCVCTVCVMNDTISPMILYPTTKSTNTFFSFFFLCNAEAKTPKYHLPLTTYMSIITMLCTLTTVHSG